MGSPDLFALGWPQTVILLISASQVAGITDMSPALIMNTCLYSDPFAKTLLGD
jgi:hypothetical protein